MTDRSARLSRICPAPGGRLHVSGRPLVMGVVNVTPDSFSDGGQFLGAEAAVAHALRLVEEGADILDIGGESTRPGAAPVPLDEELARVVPVIEALRSRTDALISIDTRKAAVMRAGAQAGADILNDVSALTFDAGSLAAAADLGLPVILMHSSADPRVMQDNPHYDDPVAEIAAWLQARIAACETAGIARASLIVDPGIGFGKTLDHNLSLLNGLAAFGELGCPVLLGASRKSFIGKLDPGAQADQRLGGSLAAALAGARAGAAIIRAHDVRETVQALTVWAAIERAGR